MPAPTIANTKTTTATKYGGDALNNVNRYLNGIDVTSTIGTPIIRTPTKIPSNILKFTDPQEDNTVTVKIPALSVDKNINLIPSNVQDNDEVVYKDTVQEVSGKVIPAGTNTISGLADSNITSLAYSKLTSVPSTFTPSTHATSHKSGGTDAIKLDELAAPTDITTLNSTTTEHGLLLKLGGGSTNFLRADGTWSAPPGSGGGEANTGVNVGTGEGSVFRDKTSLDLNFKTLKQGTNITLTNNASDVTIAATGGGTGAATSGTILRNGGSTVVTIPHGLSSTPAVGYAWPKNIAAFGSYTTTVDATNITLTYEVAPVSGTNNLEYNYLAITSTLVNGGSTAAAPTNAHYLTLFTDTALSNERVLTAGNGVTMTDGGAGSTLTVAADHRILSRLGSLVVSNTTTETDILNYVIPANTLTGSGVGLVNRAVHIRIIGQILHNTGAATGTVTLKVKLGSTIMYSDSTIAFTSSATIRPFYIDLTLFGDGDTNAQGLGGTINISDTGAASTGFGNLGSDEIEAHTVIIGTNPAKDPSTALTLQVTAAMNEANANFSITRRYSVIEQEI